MHLENIITVIQKDRGNEFFFSDFANISQHSNLRYKAGTHIQIMHLSKDFSVTEKEIFDFKRTLMLV